MASALGAARYPRPTDWVEGQIGERLNCYGLLRQHPKSTKARARERGVTENTARVLGFEGRNGSEPAVDPICTLWMRNTKRIRRCVEPCK